MYDSTNFVIGIFLILIVAVCISFFTKKDILTIFFGHLFEHSNNTTSKWTKNYVEKNDSPENLLFLVKKIINFSRKNNLFCIYPGIFSVEDKKTSLLALVVTSKKIIGINCVGFGGLIICKKDDATWTQLMNNQEKNFTNPYIDSEREKDILNQFLIQENFQELPIEICSVFTAEKVRFRGDRGKLVLKKEELFDWLKDKKLETGSINAKEFGKKLAEIRKKNK